MTFARNSLEPSTSLLLGFYGRRCLGVEEGMKLSLSLSLPAARLRLYALITFSSRSFSIWKSDTDISLLYLSGESNTALALLTLFDSAYQQDDSVSGSPNNPERDGRVMM